MLDKIPALKFTAHCWKYKYCLFCAQRHCILLLNLVPCRPRLCKRWMAPSTGLKSTQWISQLVSLILIHWIVIYPVDSAIQRLNNLVQASLRESSPIWASEASFARTRERGASAPRGVASRSRVLVRLVSLAQIGELARRLGPGLFCVNISRFLFRTTRTTQRL